MYCRKAEIEVLFDDKSSGGGGGGDGFNSRATAEAQVLVGVPVDQPLIPQINKS